MTNDPRRREETEYEERLARERRAAGTETGEERDARSRREASGITDEERDEGEDEDAGGRGEKGRTFTCQYCGAKVNRKAIKRNEAGEEIPPDELEEAPAEGEELEEAPAEAAPVEGEPAPVEGEASAEQLPAPRKPRARDPRAAKCPVCGTYEGEKFPPDHPQAKKPGETAEGRTESPWVQDPPPPGSIADVFANPPESRADSPAVRAAAARARTERGLPPYPPGTPGNPAPAIPTQHPAHGAPVHGATWPAAGGKPAPKPGTPPAPPKPAPKPGTKPAGWTGGGPAT